MERKRDGEMLRERRTERERESVGERVEGMRGGGRGVGALLSSLGRSAALLAEVSRREHVREAMLCCSVCLSVSFDD